jgi:ethanolamine utilization protein EutQ (cupin superfamily)
MAACKLIKADSRTYGEIGGTTFDKVEISRDVYTDISKTMGCGIVRHKAPLAWIVRYDEYYYCLEGKLAIEVGKDEVHVLEKGDAVWIPKDTSLVYRPLPEAVVVFALHPVDWRDHIKAI